MTIQDAYIAYYGRPADPGGLAKPVLTEDTMVARRAFKPTLARLVREELDYLLDPADRDKQQALLASIARLNQASDLLGESLSWLVAHGVQAHLEADPQARQGGIR